MTNPTQKTPPKKTAGRPRSQALDALQKELAVSRRHAASMLREQKNAASGISVNCPSPVASARLEKLNLEIRRLEHEVESARLDAEIRAGRLLSVDDAIALYCQPLQTIRDQLESLSKRFASRLHGQPVKVIETMLAVEADRIVALARDSL